MKPSKLNESENAVEKLVAQMNDHVRIGRRTIFLDNEIDITTTSFLQQRISLIVDISGDDKSAITIELSSYGGDAFALFPIVYLIQSALMKINIHGSGAIMSAAAVVLACGTGVRSMSSNSIMMLHPFSSTSDGNNEEVKKQVKHTDSLNDRVIDLISKASNKSTAFWKEMIKSEVYLTAEISKQLGLIDIIK